MNNYSVPEERMFVTVNLDNGENIKCEIMTIFDIDDQNYIVLVPLDDKGNPNEQGEYLYYRYFEDEEGNPSMDNIESDEEYEAVDERFDEILDDMEFDSM